ncbi:MAG: DUF6076 domain-containing protein [Clostridiales bacterium]|nr:DUF6076 domain-containing protein [Clostridiales bacterium]
MSGDLLFYLDGKNEYSRVAFADGGRTFTNQLGCLLFSFISIDFSDILAQTKDMSTINFANNSKILELFYKSIYNKMGAIHPLLAEDLKQNYLALLDNHCTMSHDNVREFDADTIANFFDDFYNYVLKLSAFKSKIVEIMKLCLTYHPIESTVLRYYNWSKQVNLEYINNLGINQVFDESGGDIAWQTFYSAKNVEYLIFYELEYMCLNNFCIKRCANCGEYFLPFSRKTQYCDNVFEDTNLTCKKYAQKYLAGTNPARALYNKKNNLHQMRNARKPEELPKEKLNEWRAFAQNLLAEYERKAISLDEFAERIGIDN